MTITATTTAMEAAMNPTLVAMIHIMMLAMTMHCHIHVQATLQPVLVGFMDQINIGHVMWIHGLLDHIFTQDQDICNTFLDNNFVKFFSYHYYLFFFSQEKLLINTCLF